MIRRTCYALLLTCCSVAFAEPLYKWTEADGTITFSPDKPAAGIDFDVVDITGDAASKSAGEPTLGKASAQPSEADAPEVSSPSSGVENSDAVLSTWSIDSQIKTFQTQPVQKKTAFKESNQSQNRCEDLRKRVVSLERRLQAQITAEDMDNTIVHISEYQNSFDQFCTQ